MASAGGNMSVMATTPAARALELILSRLRSAGLEATRDAGAVYPQPLAILVALPAMVGRGAAFRTFEVSVFVISGDPLNSEPAVDRIFGVADSVATVLETEAYRPSSWRGSVNAEPLPAVELTVTVSIEESEV